MSASRRRPQRAFFTEEDAKEYCRAMNYVAVLRTALKSRTKGSFYRFALREKVWTAGERKNLLFENDEYNADLGNEVEEGEGDDGEDGAEASSGEHLAGDERGGASPSERLVIVDEGSAAEEVEAEAAERPFALERRMSGRISARMAAKKAGSEDKESDSSVTPMKRPRQPQKVLKRRKTVKLAETTGGVTSGGGGGGEVVGAGPAGGASIVGALMGGELVGAASTGAVLAASSGGGGGGGSDGRALAAASGGRASGGPDGCAPAASSGGVGSGGSDGRAPVAASGGRVSGGPDGGALATSSGVGASGGDGASAASADRVRQGGNTRLNTLLRGVYDSELLSRRFPAYSARCTAWKAADPAVRGEPPQFDMGDVDRRHSAVETELLDYFENECSAEYAAAVQLTLYRVATSFTPVADRLQQLGVWLARKRVVARKSSIANVVEDEGAASPSSENQSEVAARRRARLKATPKKLTLSSKETKKQGLGKVWRTAESLDLSAALEIAQGMAPFDLVDTFGVTPTELVDSEGGRAKERHGLDLLHHMRTYFGILAVLREAAANDPQFAMNVDEYHANLPAFLRTPNYDYGTALIVESFIACAELAAVGATEFIARERSVAIGGSRGRRGRASSEEEGDGGAAAARKKQDNIARRLGRFLVRFLNYYYSGHGVVRLEDLRQAEVAAKGCFVTVHWKANRHAKLAFSDAAEVKGEGGGGKKKKGVAAKARDWHKRVIPEMQGDYARQRRKFLQPEDPELVDMPVAEENPLPVLSKTAGHRVGFFLKVLSPVEGERPSETLGRVARFGDLARRVRGVYGLPMTGKRLPGKGREHPGFERTADRRGLRSYELLMHVWAQQEQIDLALFGVKPARSNVADLLLAAGVDPAVDSANDGTDSEDEEDGV